MRIIDITHPPQSLWIGREGENTFRPVSFECANWFSAYPNATIAAYYQPYGVSDPYPLVLTVDGTKRIWNPLLSELVKGDGELQIVLMNGETVGTSAIIPTKVDRSLISNADHPASETPAWPVKVVQDVTEQADRAEEAASHYPKIVNGVWHVWSVQAEDFVSTGIEAQGEDGVSPTVQTESITGGHRVTITDAAHPTGQTFDVMDGDPGDDYVLTPQDKVEIAGMVPVPTVPTEDISANTAARHTHKNKDVLDGITAAKVQSWDGKGTYSKPSGGIPASDLASGVIPSVPQMATAADMSDWVSGKTVDAAVLKSDFTQAGAVIDRIGDNVDLLGSALESKAEKSEIPSLSGYATETWVQNQGYQTAQDVQTAIANIPDELPAVTASDNGKFLRVVSGAWAAASVPSAESNSFGGGS